MFKHNSNLLPERDNNHIIYTRKIELKTISAEIKNKLAAKINEYKEVYKPDFKMQFDEKQDSLIYETEILIPRKTTPSRPKLLIVLGNPAIHSVSEGMFFSYEKTRTDGKWREHRVWKAFKEAELLEFNEWAKNDIRKPTRANIKEINNYKRECLLDANYKSRFNIFILPYFSFPTPASGKYNGVNGIRNIAGIEVFNIMRDSEFQRFEEIISNYKINCVICFQKDALKEIVERTGASLRNSILYRMHPNFVKYKNRKLPYPIYKAPPTRQLLWKKSKQILKLIVTNADRSNYFRWTPTEKDIIIKINWGSPK